MKNLLKISISCIVLATCFIACSPVSSYESGPGPLEPGQTEMRSQSPNNDIPEPGQTEMR